MVSAASFQETAPFCITDHLRFVWRAHSFHFRHFQDLQAPTRTYRDKNLGPSLPKKSMASVMKAASVSSMEKWKPTRHQPNFIPPWSSSTAA
eukprot:1151708-Pelagomonas_calceolata.AAC.2